MNSNHFEHLVLLMFSSSSVVLMSSEDASVARTTSTWSVDYGHTIYKIMIITVSNAMLVSSILV